jgi:hypothetical protein
MKAVLAMLLLTFIGLAMAQDSSKPKIAPFFDRVDGGPAFFVDCRNATGEKRSSATSVWIQSLRLDGAKVPNSGDLLGPGLTMDVEPGQSWRAIIALRQSFRSYFPPVRFGALVRSTRVLPLDEGRHTIAVQCGEVWSEDLEFFWEDKPGESAR